MESAKQPLLFKHFSYEIEIFPMGEKKLAITIIDSSSKSQFFEKQLLLEQIGVSTLVKAFQKSKKQISFTIDQKKGGQIEMIELKVQVESQFLRPVQQILYIKKVREVSEAEALKKSIDYLTKKIRDLKTADDNQKKQGLITKMELKEKNFAASNIFQPFSEITLPKGKHLITWTFLAKATNQLMYIYLNQGQIQLLTNCAFYFPTQQTFVPVTLRKVHTVTTNQQTLTLQTYCTQSYPVTVSNCIVTAKRIN